MCLAAGAMSKRGNKTTTTTKRRDELGQRRIFLRDHSFVYCNSKKIQFQKLKFQILPFRIKGLIKEEQGISYHITYRPPTYQKKRGSATAPGLGLDLRHLPQGLDLDPNWTKERRLVHGRQNFEIQSGAAPVQVRIRPVSCVCGSAPLFPFD